MHRLKSWLPLLGLAFATTLAWAGGDEVVVIYNSRLPESKAVAEHYAKLRQVPERQIYGLSLSSYEDISRTEFRETLQLPLARKLEADGLWKFGPVILPATNGQPRRKITQVVKSKIRYAVLCYGVPLKIRPDPELHEAVDETMLPLLRHDEAAVDSELAWLPLSRSPVPLTGPLLNPFYGATNAMSLNPTNGILLVARLDGPNMDIANGLVDKAIKAERDGLWGRAYFDARGIPKTDTNYFLGDVWMLSAARIACELGFETSVDDKPATFPPVSR